MNLRAPSHLLADVTQNNHPFLAISVVFQFLFVPSCVAGKKSMFVASNNLVSQPGGSCPWLHGPRLTGISWEVVQLLPRCFALGTVPSTFHLAWHH